MNRNCQICFTPNSDHFFYFTWHVLVVCIPLASTKNDVDDVGNFKMTAKQYTEDIPTIETFSRKDILPTLQKEAPMVFGCMEQKEKKMCFNFWDCTIYG